MAIRASLEAYEYSWKCYLGFLMMLPSAIPLCLSLMLMLLTTYKRSVGVQFKLYVIRHPSFAYGIHYFSAFKYMNRVNPDFVAKATSVLPIKRQIIVHSKLHLNYWQVIIKQIYTSNNERCQPNTPCTNNRYKEDQKSIMDILLIIETRLKHAQNKNHFNFD